MKNWIIGLLAVAAVDWHTIEGFSIVHDPKDKNGEIVLVHYTNKPDTSLHVKKEDLNNPDLPKAVFDLIQKDAGQ